ncbi:18042_t:CDS:2, partial [Acaulospora morrowiae]
THAIPHDIQAHPKLHMVLSRNSRSAKNPYVRNLVAQKTGD